MSPTMTADTERLLDLRTDLAVALQGFVGHGTTYASMSFGPVRLDLLNLGGACVSVQSIHVDEPYRGIGLAGCALRTLTCFADAAGWTLAAEPERGRGSGSSPARLVKLLERHGFTGDLTEMTRSPR